MCTDIPAGQDEEITVEVAFAQGLYWPQALLKGFPLGWAENSHPGIQAGGTSCAFLLSEVNYLLCFQ